MGDWRLSEGLGLRAGFWVGVYLEHESAHRNNAWTNVGTAWL